MIVQFQEEILRAQDVAKFRRALARLRHVIGLDSHVNLALEAATHPDQSCRMRGEEFLVDARFVVKAVQVRRRDQFHEVAIARFILGQEREVIRSIALIIRAVLHRTGSHVRLAADDRFDSRFLGFLVKLDRAVEIPVVGDCDRRHPEFLRLPHQLFRPNRPIQQRVFGMEMEVNERICGHLQAV